MDNLGIQFQFGLSKEDGSQSGGVEDHLGRPFSSYRKSAWSRYGRLTRAAARLAIALSSSALPCRGDPAGAQSVPGEHWLPPESWFRRSSGQWPSRVDGLQGRSEERRVGKE